MLKILFAAVLAVASTALAQIPVTLTITGTPGITIPEDFCGVSLETGNLIPGAEGNLLLRTANLPLIGLYKSLGIKCLRIGGNTVDRDDIPSQDSVDNLFAFAKTIDADVIYSLKLKNSDAKSNIPMAKYIYAKYASQLKCLSIGNEPNYYIPWATYKSDVDTYISAITAEVPEAKFCGADAGHATQTWAANFADTYRGNPHIGMVVQHDYQGNGKKISGQPARDGLLATSRMVAYQKFYDSWAANAVRSGFPFRLTECNSYTAGGSPDCSETYASALWVVDYMYWWASHGCDGVNLHTANAYYKLYEPVADGYAVHPVSYGVKAFTMAAHGKLLPVELANASIVNLTAYAVLAASDSSIYVTIVNKEHDKGARGAIVTIKLPKPVSVAGAMVLTAPKNDVAATSGVTLGGSAIGDDGKWNGVWQTLTKGADGNFTIPVAGASAVVVHLK